MKKFLIITGIIVLLFASFIYQMGLVSEVKVSEKEIGPFKAACQDYTGPYQQVDKGFKKVNDILGNEFGIKPARGFGIYYDDRRNLLPGKFKAKIGYIIEEADYAKLPEIAKKLEVVDYPATKCVSADFPLLNDFSSKSGPVKIYPELYYYCEKNGITHGPQVEIYDTINSKIIYGLQILEAQKQ